MDKSTDQVFYEFARFLTRHTFADLTIDQTEAAFNRARKALPDGAFIKWTDAFWKWIAYKEANNGRRILNN